MDSEWHQIRAAISKQIWDKEYRLFVLPSGLGYSHLAGSSTAKALCGKTIAEGKYVIETREIYPHELCFACTDILFADFDRLVQKQQWESKVVNRDNG